MTTTRVAVAKSAVPAAVAHVVQSAGHPLDTDTRGFMESRFAHNFADVRIHDDAAARASATSIGAYAYTFGAHIVGAALTPHTLAHELAHVVQQRRPASALLSDPADASERQAHSAADAVFRGGTLPALDAAPAAIQRTVSAPVREDIRRGATACFVRLHREERDAMASMQEVQRRHCVNAVWLEGGGSRCVTTTFTGGSCTADPNRIFSTPAITNANAYGPTCACDSALQRAATADLHTWRDTTLLPAIQRCIANDLPIIAMHNNTPGAPLDIRSFDSSTPRRRGYRDYTSQAEPQTGNPHVGDPANPDNFVLATRPSDFAAFTGLYPGRNAVLQSQAGLGDDGSLSYALRARRFFNVEHVQPRPARGVPTSATEAEEVLTALGANSAPCA
ncbi:MAG: DUF4157 domain-containing protein [Thermoanaerobaculia bacterium]